MRAKPRIAVDDRAVSAALHEDGCSICKHPQRGAIERELTGWANIVRLARQYHVNRGDIYRHANSFNLFSRHGRNVRRTLGRIIEYAEQVSLTAGPVVVTLEACARINDSGHQQLKPSESSRYHKQFDRMTDCELQAYATGDSLPDWFKRVTPLADETGEDVSSNSDSPRNPTGSLPRPGDFPIGSWASRAAARLMLNRRIELSPYEEDCCTLYDWAFDLREAEPHATLLERTEVYRRGMEISMKRDALKAATHPDSGLGRQSLAVMCFQMLRGRLPQPGDKLRHEDILRFDDPEGNRRNVEKVQGAWARQISDVSCPIRYQDGKVLLRDGNGDWMPKRDLAPFLWEVIQHDASDPNPGPRKFERPFESNERSSNRGGTMTAVIFVQDETGRLRVVPMEQEI